MGLKSGGFMRLERKYILSTAENGTAELELGNGSSRQRSG
jgi:hypothetical protein